MGRCPGRSWGIAALLLTTLTARVSAQDSTGVDGLVRYRITPSHADSSVRRFDEPHYVVFARTVSTTAPLLVFLPGSGGRPAATSDFADVAARQGYRVIGLEYTDTPAVVAICARDRDPNCSERVRRKRIFGEDVTPLIDDRPEESIVSRLTHLLVTLQHDHVGQGWEQYLTDGAPNWPRIAVAGLSQGAGMAAFIAQRTAVARVILFSSPWDNFGPRHTLAPWVTRGTGATPAARWFAVYHEKEATADLIARAYEALHIPRDQVRVFTLEPAVVGTGNPYHPSTVANRPTPRAADGTPAYADQWRYLLGDVR